MFYFQEGKNLCWVAGYTADKNTVKANDIIKSLQENTQKFADIAGVDTDMVRTDTIQQSRRYKDMRFFFVCNFDGTLPDGTYEVKGEGWTMMKWLTD